VSPVVLTVRSPTGTAALARLVAAVVRGGDVLVLTGDLGAGKTLFTKAFAAALGVTSPVTSPTFTLANRYEGDLTLHHLDAYRIAGPAEVLDLGLDELVGPTSVTVIEWGDVIAPALPGDRLEIALEHPDAAEGLDDEHRVITLSTPGGSWTERLRHLAAGTELRTLTASC
jgi:tRNA threonylcarbamoyladenosine biosynthesis protein TsaE